MNLLFGVVLGILIGLGFSYDMLISERPPTKGFLVRYAVFLIIMNIVRVLGIIINNEENILEILTIILIAFLISVLIALSIAYLFYLRLNSRYKAEIFVDGVISYADLMSKGYPGFKKELKEAKEDNEKKIYETNTKMIKVINDITDPVSKFINRIYRIAYDKPFKEADPMAYILFVLVNFIRYFLSESEARIFLRKLNPERKQMEVIKTTSNSIPSAIPLNKQNMITASMEAEKPLIYSQNKKLNYDTGKSHKQGKYIDYVTYCLLKTRDGKPLYSVTLDVKNEETQKKMLALVESHFFEIICEPIKVKLAELTRKEKSNG
jgi:hypothetical protein